MQTITALAWLALLALLCFALLIANGGFSAIGNAPHFDALAAWSSVFH